MFSLADLNALSNSPAPVLTWYEPAGRAEFLGPQLAQWIVKTANYLSEASGEDVSWNLVFHLPPSWRSLVWWAAAQMCGFTPACHTGEDLSEGDDGLLAGADLLVSSTAQVLDTVSSNYPATVVLAQAMGPLTLSWPGPLPAGVDDAIGQVSAQPDQLVTPMVAPVGTTVAGAIRADVPVALDAHHPNWRQQCLLAWRRGERPVWVAPGLDSAAIYAQEGLR